MHGDDAGGGDVSAADGGLQTGTEAGEGGGDAVGDGGSGADPLAEGPLAEEVAASRRGAGEEVVRHLAGGGARPDEEGADGAGIEGRVGLGLAGAEGAVAADEAEGGREDGGHAQAVAHEGLVEPAVDVLVRALGVARLVVPDGLGAVGVAVFAADDLAALVVDGVACGVEGVEGLGGEPGAGAGLALGEGDGDGALGGGGLVDEEEGDDEVVLVGKGLAGVVVRGGRVAVEGDEAGGGVDGDAAAAGGEPGAGGDGGLGLGGEGGLVGVDVALVQILHLRGGEGLALLANEHDVADELGRQLDGFEAVARARLVGEDVLGVVRDGVVDPLGAGLGDGAGAGLAGGALGGEVAFQPRAAGAGAVGGVADDGEEGDPVPVGVGVGADGVVVRALALGLERPLGALGGHGGDAAGGVRVGRRGQLAHKLDGAGFGAGIGDAGEDVDEIEGARRDGRAARGVDARPDAALGRAAGADDHVGRGVRGRGDVGDGVGVRGRAGLREGEAGEVDVRACRRAVVIIGAELPVIGGGLRDAGVDDAGAEHGEDDLGIRGGTGALGEVHLVEPDGFGRGGIEIEVRELNGRRRQRLVPLGEGEGIGGRGLPVHGLAQEERDGLRAGIGGEGDGVDAPGDEGDEGLARAIRGAEDGDAGGAVEPAVRGGVELDDRHAGGGGGGVVGIGGVERGGDGLGGQGAVVHVVETAEGGGADPGSVKAGLAHVVGVGIEDEDGGELRADGGGVADLEAEAAAAPGLVAAGGHGRRRVRPVSAGRLADVRPYAGDDLPPVSLLGEGERGDGLGGEAHFALRRDVELERDFDLGQVRTDRDLGPAVRVGGAEGDAADLVVEVRKPGLCRGLGAEVAARDGIAEADPDGGDVVVRQGVIDEVDVGRARVADRPGDAVAVDAAAAGVGDRRGGGVGAVEDLEGVAAQPAFDAGDDGAAREPGVGDQPLVEVDLARGDLVLLPVVAGAGHLGGVEAEGIAGGEVREVGDGGLVDLVAAGDPLAAHVDGGDGVGEAGVGVVVVLDVGGRAAGGGVVAVVVGLEGLGDGQAAAVHLGGGRLGADEADGVIGGSRVDDDVGEAGVDFRLPRGVEEGLGPRAAEGRGAAEDVVVRVRHVLAELLVGDGRGPGGGEDDDVLGAAGGAVKVDGHAVVGAREADGVVGLGPAGVLGVIGGEADAVGDGVEGAVGGGIRGAAGGDDAGVGVHVGLGVLVDVDRDVVAVGDAALHGVGDAPAVDVEGGGEAELDEGGEVGAGRGGGVGEVELVDEGLAGDAGVDPVIGGEAGGGVPRLHLRVEVAGEVPGELGVVGLVDDGAVPLVGLGLALAFLGLGLVNGPDGVADEGVGREGEELGERLREAAGEGRLVGVASQLEGVGIKRGDVGGRGDGGGVDLAQPAADVPLRGVLEAVDGAGGAGGVVAAEGVGVRVACGGAEGVRVGGGEGVEDADGAGLDALFVAEGGLDAQVGGAGDGLGEGRFGVEGAGGVVGEGDVGHAKGGRDGVLDGEAVDEHLAVGGGVGVRDGAGEVARDGPEAQARGLLAFVRHRVVGGVGEGGGGEVKVIDLVDGVGDVEGGQDGEVLGGQILVRGGRGRDVEADGRGVGGGEAGGEGEAADAVLQRGGFEVGVGDLGVDDGVVEVEGLGEAGALSEGLLDLVGEAGGGAILPVQQVDGGRGELGVAGGPGGEDAGPVVGDGDVVEPDAGVVGGVVPVFVGDEHDEAEGAGAADELLARLVARGEAGDDADGGPVAGGVGEEDGGGDVDPILVAGVAAEVVVGVVVVLPELEEEADGGAGAAVGGLRDAVAEGDGAEAAPAVVGRVEGERGAGDPVGAHAAVAQALGELAAVGVLARALHDEDLLALVGVLGDGELGVVLGADPDADGREAVRLRAADDADFLEAEVGEVGDVVAVALGVVAAPGGDGDVVEVDAGGAAFDEEGDRGVGLADGEAARLRGAATGIEGIIHAGAALGLDAEDEAPGGVGGRVHAGQGDGGAVVLGAKRPRARGGPSRGIGLALGHAVKEGGGGGIARGGGIGDVTEGGAAFGAVQRQPEAPGRHGDRLARHVRRGGDRGARRGIGGAHDEPAIPIHPEAIAVAGQMAVGQLRRVAVPGILEPQPRGSGAVPPVELGVDAGGGLGLEVGRREVDHLGEAELVGTVAPDILEVIGDGDAGGRVGLRGVGGDAGGDAVAHAGEGAAALRLDELDAAGEIVGDGEGVVEGDGAHAVELDGGAGLDGGGGRQADGRVGHHGAVAQGGIGAAEDDLGAAVQVEVLRPAVLAIVIRAQEPGVGGVGRGAPLGELPVDGV